MGLEEYEDGREFSTFLALTLYNKGQARESLQLLLRNLLETSKDEVITQYDNALSFYCEKPDPPYEEK